MKHNNEYNKANVLEELGEAAPFLKGLKQKQGADVPLPTAPYFDQMADAVMAKIQEQGLLKPAKKRLKWVYWGSRVAAVWALALGVWALWPPPVAPTMAVQAEMPPPPQYRPENKAPAVNSEVVVSPEQEEMPVPLPHIAAIWTTPQKPLEADQHPQSGLTEAELLAFLADNIEDVDLDNIEE